MRIPRRKRHAKRLLCAVVLEWQRAMRMMRRRGQRSTKCYWAPRAAPMGSFSSSPSARGEENNSQPGVNPGNEVGS